jgi:hypothetical protein
MIRFRYSEIHDPPAPFVNVTVTCPTRLVRTTCPAQLDTGADCTVLPRSIVEELELLEDGYWTIQGFVEEQSDIPLFTVDLGIQALPPVRCRVVLGANEKYVLLGRDVINAYRMILDGPKQVLDIE